MQNFQFQKSLIAKHGSKERLDPKTADDQDEILMESKMFGQPGSLQGFNQSNPGSSLRSKTGLKKVMFDPKAPGNIVNDKLLKE